ncbi:hypothetical protein GS529_05045 [Saccharibacter sp. EH70]|nr:hypothetical protein [Saccharibacter sp. EH70]
MYLRYLPLLAARGAHLHVWGNQELANLMQHVDGVQLVQVDGDCPEYDYHCPFISLPRAFNGLPNERMGQPVPYLHVPPHKTEYWFQKSDSAPSHSLRIGIAWAGGEHNEGREARLLDRHRSMPLSELSALFSIPQISFYSLQKGPAATQLNHDQYPIIDFMPECNDMEDTAALIQGLDLIVTVDTSIVHLAGGLGKPTIMMDRFCNCWRWGYHSSTSIWYPSLQIYRQKEFDNWSNVICDVKDFIISLLKERV